MAPRVAKIASNLPHHRKLSRMWSVLVNVSKQLVDPCDGRAHVGCSIKQMPMQSKCERKDLRRLHECNIITLQKNSPCMETTLSLHNHIFSYRAIRWQAHLRTADCRGCMLLLTYLEVSCFCASTTLLLPRQVPSSCIHQSPTCQFFVSSQLII